MIPVLVLTGLREKFQFVPLGKKTDAVLPVCSGDMLFNVFDEYIGFLAEENGGIQLKKISLYKK